MKAIVLTENTPVTILYHADCLDGFGAAYAAWCRFGDAAIYRPLHHGEAWDTAEISGHAVFILDFSFPPSFLQALAKIAASLTQIDHHVSAYQAWADKLQAVDHKLFEHRQTAPPLRVIFDLQKSGARLAWEHFHPNHPVPIALQHIEDQDMWRFALPGTRAFCRALRLQSFDFKRWNELIEQTPDTDTVRYREMIAQGEAIDTFFQNAVAGQANGALRMPAYLRGEPVDALQALRHGQAIISAEHLAWLTVEGIAANTHSMFASDLGNALAEQSASFGLIWQLGADGDVKVSLRSQGSFDVAAIAARYGGGGHRNAAGFRVSLKHFLAEVLRQT